MDNRNAVITGASAGIGAALAELLATRGDRVVLVARRPDRLAEVAALCGGRAHVIAADVTNRAEVQRVVREAIDILGHVDAWVNNVGQGISRMPSELTDDDLDDMMRMNVKSALYGMQEILPHLVSRGAGQIVNVSSQLGRVPFALQRSAYSASKHFLNALTAMFREEVQQSHPGIQVTLVSPGIVRTEFGLNARHGGADSRTMPNSQSAEEVAAVIASALDTRVADVYTSAGAQQRIAGYYAGLGVDP